jgi:hypothetical protein
MQFSELYGTELDRELGTADTTQRFTVVRRKAAINAAQLEWVKRTECFQRQTTVSLVTGTQEYDLEATITDFAWIAKQGVSIKIVSGTTTRYIEGRDLQVTSVERLNTEEPSWRAVAASTPKNVYLRRDGGTVNLGFHPAPAITGTDVWTALVPYVVVPADMSADADEPFTVSANPLKSMRPWHRALVHFAAYDLEKLRKDTQRGGAQLQLFELEVAKFTGVEKPKGGGRVRLATDYRQQARVGVARRVDPRS